MYKLNDFIVGEIVINHYKVYCPKTYRYSPAKRIAKVMKIGESGVTIRIDKNNTNPDYDIHVGSKCLDTLEKTGITEKDNNVIPFIRK